ncbi:MAG: glycosyltransferase family 2 protein, partial [Nitrososphaeraceae archaeon]
MNNKTLISVIIPTFNSSKTLLQCLSSLEKSKFEKEKFEVLVIDDGSTDDTRNEIKKFKNETTLQLNYFIQRHFGPGSARNLGLKNAKSNVIAFTDADCIVDDNWLSVIYKSIIIDGDTIIGGLIFNDDVLIFPWKISPIGQQKVTANLAIKYDQLKGILFSEEFKYVVGDDIDFIIRIQDLGYNFKHISEMKIKHPPHVYNLKQMIKRSFYRMNEVLLYKKHGKKVNGSFHLMFRPIIFRFSPITIIFALLIILFILALKVNYIFILIYFLTIFTFAFIFIIY